MSEIEKINHVFEYNDRMGVETLNPLVSVVDWSQCQPMCSSRCSYGFYAVFLKDVKCGDMRYGRQYYDYQEGTLVFLAPGQVYGIESNGVKVQPKGWALVFHPDLIRGTSLGRHIDNYTFFSYEVISFSTPFIPSLKECMPLPIPLINSGIFLPPNNSNTTNTISSTSGIPTLPINNEFIILYLRIIWLINSQPPKTCINIPGNPIRKSCKAT